jgi:hypothetical protein
MSESVIDNHMPDGSTVGENMGDAVAAHQNNSEYPALE